jgi:hypothetical protein
MRYDARSGTLLPQAMTDQAPASQEGELAQGPTVYPPTPSWADIQRAVMLDQPIPGLEPHPGPGPGPSPPGPGPIARRYTAEDAAIDEYWRRKEIEDEAWAALGHAIRAILSARRGFMERAAWIKDKVTWGQ